MDKSTDQSDKGRPSFWTTLPGVLTAITSFIAAIVGLLVAIQQLKSKPDTSTPPPSSGSPGPSTTTVQPSNTATSCGVSGFVYDQDKLPAVASLADIKIAYVTASKPGFPVHMKTTGPRGDFNFTCPQMNPADFPLHLQMTYSWGAQNQVVQWDDPIFAGNNGGEALYLSLHEATNWHRNNMTLMHVNPSTRLQRIPILSTNKASGLRLPTH